jgi:hypothetical protein
MPSDFRVVATMFVTVKTLTGRKIQFDVNETMTFKNLKEEISAKEGIEIPQIRMIYSGAMVNDLQKIHESKIKSGDTIHLVLSLRGG